jgi:hypothetical protein
MSSSLLSTRLVITRVFQVSDHDPAMTPKISDRSLTSVKLIKLINPLPWPALATTHVIVVLAIHPNRLLAAIK